MHFFQSAKIIFRTDAEKFAFALYYPAVKSHIAYNIVGKGDFSV